MGELLIGSVKTKKGSIFDPREVVTVTRVKNGISPNTIVLTMINGKEIVMELPEGLIAFPNA